MITILTDENKKREEIEKNFQENCMIEAGAGAGKTTIIISRIISQLKLPCKKSEDGSQTPFIKPEQLVVITFTKAAAGELRDRLAKELKKEYEKETNDDLKANLKNALDNQSLIQVSTIHSFCFRLLQERALDASLPLDINMLDKVASEKRLDNFFKEWLFNQDKDEIARLNSEYYNGSYAAALYTCFCNIAELPDMDFKYRHDLIETTSLSSHINKMKKQFSDFIDEIKNVAKNNNVALNITGNEVLKAVKDINSAINMKGVYKFIDLYQTVFIKKFLDKNAEACVFKKNTKLNFLNNMLFPYITNLKNYKLELDLYENAIVVEKAIEARQEYLKYLNKKENKHNLSNDQLLKEALKLVNKENALKHFQKEFKYIYVDEFQDTDTVQRDLVYKLVKDIDSNKFIDGSFFLVGDPKQSIYAFRGADLEVYKDTKANLEKDEYNNVYVYELSRNHRSEKKIIDWVNREFINDEYGIGKIYLDMEAAHDALEQDKLLNGVYVLGRPKQKPSEVGIKAVKGDLLEYESNFLPKFIQQLMKDYQITIYKKDGTSFIRPIKYSDFLVLSEKKEVLESYANKLKDAGIAINLYGALDLGSDSLILRFKALLHYLANPNDERAKYAAMEVLNYGFINDENMDQASKVLDEFKNKFLSLEASKAINLLCHDISYYLDEENKKAKIDYIFSRLNQVYEFLISNGVLTIKDYDELLDEYIESGVDKELSLVMGEDTVRLMNLHKSKGLEGKIVIILGRFNTVADKQVSYRDKYEYYPSIPINSKTFLASYLDENDPYIQNRPKEARKGEKVRLEYVEATRAEEALIFFDNNASTKAVFEDFNFDNCVNLCEENAEIKKLYEESFKEQEDINNSEYKTVDWKCQSIDLEACKNKSQNYIAKSPSNYEHEYKEDWITDSEKRPKGATFGTILHRCFELAVLAIRKGENVICDEIINQSLLESIQNLKNNDFEKNIKEYKEYLKLKLEDFLNSKLIELVKKAKNVYPEYQFNFFINKEMRNEIKNVDIEDEDIWFSGKADLVLVNDNRIDVYDYKTDTKGNNSIIDLEKHLEDTYGDQQKLYCFALSKCFNIEIDKVKYHFYHLYNEE